MFQELNRKHNISEILAQIFLARTEKQIVDDLNNNRSRTVVGVDDSDFNADQQGDNIHNQGFFMGTPSLSSSYLGSVSTKDSFSNLKILPHFSEKFDPLKETNSNFFLESEELIAFYAAKIVQDIKKMGI